MGSRDFEVLPVLCGALDAPNDEYPNPGDDPSIVRAVATIRDEVERSGRRAVYIAGADLAHVGPHFGDEDAVTESALKSLGARDLATLERVAEGDPRRFYDDVMADDDARKICGIAPIWALLAALGGGARGEVLHYGQAREPEYASVVTYGSAAFYR
jgi:AmmeMemoRadiSam system protein B